jgi:hypothetical protein
MYVSGLALCIFGVGIIAYRPDDSARRLAEEEVEERQAKDGMQAGLLGGFSEGGVSEGGFREGGDGTGRGIRILASNTRQ